MGMITGGCSLKTGLELLQLVGRTENVQVIIMIRMCTTQRGSTIWRWRQNPKNMERQKKTKNMLQSLPEENLKVNGELEPWRSKPGQAAQSGGKQSTAVFFAVRETGRAV